MRINIERGFDLALPGEPSQAVDAAAPVGSVALLGLDYANLKPVLAIAEGEAVGLGQTLFTDRAEPTIRVTAPASGHIAAIHRGRKRRLVSIVIEVGEPAGHDAFCEPIAAARLATLARAVVVERLLESGLWTALRARPFDGIASPAVMPRALFVTALDTRPLAADPDVVIRAASEAWQRGLTVLTRLCERVLVCSRSGTPQPQQEQIVGIEIAGPHPAGLPGTVIERLAAAGDRPDLWHIGYQDVIAIGRLFAEGRLSTERIVAIGGPGARRPRLVATRAGASLSDLLRAELLPASRVVAGSVLDGRQTDAPTHYLGRHETQISALVDDPDTGLRHRGRPSGMLNVEAFERIWPFALPPLPLLRALLVHDLDAARRLGVLGLAPEDLALCSYVCPAQLDYGAALTSTLEALRAEL